MARSLGPLDEKRFASDIPIGGPYGKTVREQNLLDFVAKAENGEDTPSLAELDERAKNGEKIQNLDSEKFRTMYERIQAEAKLNKEGPQGLNRR